MLQMLANQKNERRRFWEENQQVLFPHRAESTDNLWQPWPCSGKNQPPSNQYFSLLECFCYQVSMLLKFPHFLMKWTRGWPLQTDQSLHLIFTMMIVIQDTGLTPSPGPGRFTPSLPSQYQACVHYQMLSTSAQYPLPYLCPVFSIQY